jgi:hypothetical protein
LLYGASAGIVERSLEDGSERVIIAPPERSSLRDPAVSPDGRTIAYVQALPMRPGTGGVPDRSADLLLADRDGGNPRTLYTHQRPAEFVQAPQWLGDDMVYAVVSVVTGFDPATGSQTEYRVARFDVASGVRTDVLEGVAEFGVASDGALAYTRRSPDIVRSVFTSAADGSGETELIGEDALLGDPSSPRFADGGALYFAAIETASGRRPSGRSPPVHGGLKHLFAVEEAETTPRFIVDMEEPSPSLAVDADGGTIYALGQEGLHTIDLGTGEHTRTPLAGGVHGHLAWTSGE